MRDKCWLICTESGIKKMRKAGNGLWVDRDIQLRSGQFAVMVEVEIPDEAFRPRPLPGVKIEISAASLREPAQTISDRPAPAPTLVIQRKKRK